MSQENYKINGHVSGQSAAAIAEIESSLKGVMLRKVAGGFEVGWTNTTDDELDWAFFAAQCGLLVPPVGETEAGNGKLFAVGFSSAGVVFNRIDAPAVDEEEVAAIVKLQAEAKLPLPAEQMEFCWRSVKLGAGRLAVTTAAARKEQMQKFLSRLNGLEPDKIILDCEGIVEAWRRFFGGNDGASVVMSIGARTTQICLAEAGRMINAASLDAGMEDFSAAGEDEALAGRVLERFAQDIISVLDLFGGEGVSERAIYVLSDGGNEIEKVVTYLKSEGLKARVAQANTGIFVGEKILSAEQLYEYRTVIGLASMALNQAGGELALFARLYLGPKEKAKGPWYYRPKASWAIAAASVVIFVLGFYAADVWSYGYMESLKAQSGYGRIVQKNKLMKQVASQRADILGLLKVLNADADEGLLLDSMEFRKDRPVIIMGQGRDAEQVYKFQQSLLSQKDITEVKIQNAAEDKKNRQVKFTIVFQYGRTGAAARTLRLSR